MTQPGRDARGTILGEALVSLVVIAAVMPLALNLHLKAAAARAERASLERMSELASEYLAEARLDDCAQFTPTSPHQHGTPCFAPLSHHITDPPVDPANPVHLTDFVVTELNGRSVWFEVSLADRDSSPEHGIEWPTRTVTVTDYTGTLTLTRSAVGKPS